MPARQFVEVALEGRLTGEHLVGDDTQAEDVGAGIQRVSAALFGRHVKRCAEDRSHSGQRATRCREPVRGWFDRVICRIVGAVPVLGGIRVVLVRRVFRGHRLEGGGVWSGYDDCAALFKVGGGALVRRSRRWLRSESLAAGIEGGCGECLVAVFGEAEIEDFDSVAAAPVRFEPDVVRLEVAMNDAGLVGFLHGGAHLFQDIDDPFDRKAGLLGEHFGQRAAVEVLHDQISDPPAAQRGESEVRHIHDVGMAHPSGSLRFAPEPFHEGLVEHELRSDHFEGHRPVGAQMGRQIDGAHPAATEMPLDAIRFIESSSDEV